MLSHFVTIAFRVSTSMTVLSERGSKGKGSGEILYLWMRKGGKIKTIDG